MNLQQAKRITDTYERNDHNAYQTLLELGYSHMTAAKAAKRTIQKAVRRVQIGDDADYELKQGGVYVIGSMKEGLYKVGFSKSPEGRCKSLSTSTPFPISSYAIYTPNNGREMEKYLHHSLDNQHQHGEWFKCDLETIFIIAAKYYESENNKTK